MKQLFAFFLFFGLILQLKAQQAPKNDVLLKVNGDELIGKVTEIGDTDVKFTYQGETLVYAIKKEDILKITYASGRIEFFNKPPLSSEKSNQPTSPGLADHHNKVAILPFSFIKNSQSASDDMSYKAQQDTYDMLSKHSTGLTIIDPRTSNALLMKAGINRTNLMGYTMDEICNVLGVEYVVDGTITQNQGAATTSTVDNYSASDDKNKDRKKVSGYSSTTSTQNYQTSVSLSIYTDKNDNIYNVNRRALLAQNEGSYDSPLQYLLKRCPLYRK